MDNMRLQDEILAKLIGILDKPVMQMVEAAVSVVLRNYDVTRKETALSTTVVEFPELDMFLEPDAVPELQRCHYYPVPGYVGELPGLR